jgi:hypothetical protein
MTLKSGPPPADASWSLDLPIKLKLSIADALVVFGRLETTLLEIVWILENSNLEEKQELTRDARFAQTIQIVEKCVAWPVSNSWPNYLK